MDNINTSQDHLAYMKAKCNMNSPYGMAVQIANSKGLTGEQALMHITALENEVAIMYHELEQLHDNFQELEYSDPDSCSQYNSEDVWTLLNIYQNHMQRCLRYTSDFITAMKAQCMEVSDDN